jgi:hypothetical protein
MPEIQYPKNPNSDTVFVVQEDGTKNRALMTAPQDTSSLELPTNSNSCKGYVTVDGKKQRVILTADIGSGGGSSYTAGTGIDITSGVISVKTPVTSTGVGGLTAGEGYSTTDTQQWITRFGRGTQTTGAGSSAFGNSARATENYSTALGASAYAYANYAIQLGMGTNSTPNTFKVGLSNNSNYELLSSDGTIPEARLADTTNAQQGDVLTLDSTGNAVWQAGGGGGGSYTAGDGIDITNNAINVQMPVKYNDDNSYAIGIATQLGAFVYNSVAIGTMASAASEAVNIGGGGPVPQGTISIGNFQSTPSERGVVLFHTQDSNFNYHTYKMLEEDGTVPADRLASTANLADGNYRLRCTITNGVPTLSWVAE